MNINGLCFLVAIAGFGTAGYLMLREYQDKSLYLPDLSPEEQKAHNEQAYQEFTEHNDRVRADEQAAAIAEAERIASLSTDTEIYEQAALDLDVRYDKFVNYYDTVSRKIVTKWRDDCQAFLDTYPQYAPLPTSQRILRYVLWADHVLPQVGNSFMMSQWSIEAINFKA